MNNFLIFYQFDGDSHVLNTSSQEVEKLTEDFKEKYKDYKQKAILIAEFEHSYEQDQSNDQIIGEIEYDEPIEKDTLYENLINNPMKMEKVLAYIEDFKRKFQSNTDVMLKVKDKMKLIETPSFLFDEDEKSLNSKKNTSMISSHRYTFTKPIHELSPNVNLKSIRIYRGDSEKEYNYLDFSSRYQDYSDMSSEGY